MNCKNCNQKEATRYSKYTTGEFCSKKCSRAYSTKDKRIELNKKISESLTGRGHGIIKLECEYCKNEFEIEWKRRNQKFCSRSCNKSFSMSNGNIASEMGKKSAEAQSKNRRSKNEIYFAELCQKQFNHVLTNESKFNGWDADVIIEDIKFAVLWNGRWHYDKLTESHSVKQVQNRDKIKIKEIKNSGYIPYIIKDLGKSNNSLVEKEFDKFICFLKQNNYLCV